MKLGLIGLDFGRHFLRILREKGHDVVVATRITGPVFNDPDIKAIIIASPPRTHFEYIKLALEKGKDVLVEKPMVLSVRSALEIQRLIGRNIFMVGHQYLYNDALYAFVERINKGAVGELREIKMEHYFARVRKDIDVFWDAAPHEFAILDLFNVGEMMNVRGRLSKERASVDIIFKNVRVKLEYSSNSHKSHTWAFTGEKGTLHFEDTPKKEPLLAEVEHFINCITYRNTPLTDIEHGIRVIRNMESVARTLV